MKSKIILCFALVLSGGLFGCSAAAQSSAESEPFRGFPILPPITNANPSIRVPLLVHVPTKLKIERTTDMLSVEVDQSSLEATNLMVGTNMVIGVQSEEYVFPEGEPRPANGKYGWGTDFNLGTSLLHTRPDGIPLPGKKYIVEVDLTVFETDVPPQHEWQPQGSKYYKVLWLRTLRQTVLNTATFLQNIFQRIEQQIPELRPTGTTTGTSSPAEPWKGEEYASAGFSISKNPRYHAPGEFARGPTNVVYADLLVTIHRYASGGEAQSGLKLSLRSKQAVPAPKGIYKGATLYQYQGGSGGVMTALCQSGQYIVETSAYSEGGISWTMKVLDVVLAELDSASSKPKQASKP